MLSQVKDHFPSAEVTDMTSVTRDHAVDRFIFGTRLTHLLHALIAVLDKFNASLSQCGVEVRT